MGPRQVLRTKSEAVAKQKDNERLAQALRDNLHRRKAQARARSNSVRREAGDTVDSSKQKKMSGCGRKRA